ncbi:ACN9-domain-containing protein, partial [Violaceomyces palustris]
AVREANSTLLPPIQLYRALFRAHRKLIPEMRSLGDSYIKDEFRRHQNIDNPLQIVAFLGQWKMYLDQLQMDQGQPGGSVGKRLDPEKLDKLSDEQIYQLHELMLATAEVFDPEKAQATPPAPDARALAEEAAQAEGFKVK